MRFVDPKTDFAFKKIFGSEEHKDLLLSLLNAILIPASDLAIAEVTLLDPYQAPKIKGIKDTYVDVKARSADGRDFIIEMQVLNVEGFEKRILYNACKRYATQLEIGAPYPELSPVIAVTFTDFVMFEDYARGLSVYRLREDRELVEYPEGDLELIFVELPKFDEREGEPTGLLEKWVYFLSRAAKLETVPPVLAAEPAIGKAFGVANAAGWTREELDEHERRVFWIQDHLGVEVRALKRGRRQGLEEGRAEGLEEGRAEGLEEGRAEGLREGRAEGLKEGRAEGGREMLRQVVSSLRAAGLGTARIAELTGLSQEELAGLDSS